MAEIVEIQLDDGELVLAEVSIASGDVAAWDRFSMSAVKSAIGRIGQWARDSVLKGLPEQPDTVGIEFGIKFAVSSGEVVNVLAEASGEATITVKMEWNKTI